MNEVSTDDIPHTFLCPITCAIMDNPHACSDGTVYEKEAIDECLELKAKSPLTGMIINKETYPILILKEQIENYLSKHPDKKKEQYISTPKKYMDAYNDITKILSFDKAEIIEMFVCAYSRTHILNNLTTYEQFTIQDGTQRCMIGLIVAYGNEKIVKYTLKKFVDETINSAACVNLLNIIRNIDGEKLKIIFSHINKENIEFLKRYRVIIEWQINENNSLNQYDKKHIKKIVSNKIKKYDRSKLTFSKKISSMFSKNKNISQRLVGTETSESHKLIDLDVPIFLIDTSNVTNNQTNPDIVY
jgi:uncharacterized protein YfeS